MVFFIACCSLCKLDLKVSEAGSLHFMCTKHYEDLFTSARETTVILYFYPNYLQGHHDFLVFLFHQGNLLGPKESKDIDLWFWYSNALCNKQQHYYL